jgi:hypothetical protein
MNELTKSTFRNLYHAEKKLKAMEVANGTEDYSGDGGGRSSISKDLRRSLDEDHAKAERSGNGRNGSSPKNNGRVIEIQLGDDEKDP